MPIVDVEIVLKINEILRDDLASVLAIELGKIFKSPPGTTWVKLHVLERWEYAENSTFQEEVHPIFIKVIKSKLPDTDKLQDEAELIAVTISNICGRPRENIHTIFEPEGAGRIAFGGHLVN